MPMIHNRGRLMGDKAVARKIIFPQGWDKEGKPLQEDKKYLTETLKPGEHKKVTDAQFAHLKELFPFEIVNIEDIADLQAQFKEKAPEAPREGYLSPDEVQERVDAAVAKALKGVQNGAGPDDKKSESREEMILRLDKMDRSDLTAFIDQNKLKINPKDFKAPGTLQAAVLTALDNQKAAESITEE